MQAFAQGGDGVMKTGADRAEGNAQCLGDLGVGEGLGEAQVENFALHWRQGCDGLAGGLHARVRDGGRKFGETGVDGHRALAGMARPDGLAQVAGDAEQVTTGASWRAAILQASRHFQEGFLNQVADGFSTVMAAGKVARKIGDALREETFQKGRMVRGVHVAFGRVCRLQQAV